MVHAGRRKGKARSRILYWFRTPPGVRVGRAPLDEDAIRLIEANNPGLQFDWTRILKGQPDPGERAAAPQEPPRQSKPERRKAERPAPQAPPRAETSAPPAPSAPEPSPEPEIDEPMTASRSRLGAEGLARLRGRYAEMLARISERVAEPERQAELKELAERLNPDAWVTDADVTAGLESYEATFESLRGALGPRRPRE